jgi:5'-nucleotidase
VNPKLPDVRRIATALVAITLMLAACADDETTEPPPTTRSPAAATTTDATVETSTPATTAPTTAAPTTAAVPATPAPAAPLQILVTNDDGIEAPGIDALVTGLQQLDDVDVLVVSPAENQSGTSMNLTDGDLATNDAATASGVAAIAVAGFPADSVRWALENLDAEIDLVVSGSNTGQNIGEFSAISGTVGAARYGAQQGIPAVAVSQGFVPDGGEIIFDDSVAVAVEWIAANRAAYDAGEVSLVSINAATCEGGNRGPIEVPLAPSFDGRDPIAFDCASTRTDPVDDVDAFANGFTAITELPIVP